MGARGRNPNPAQTQVAYHADDSCTIKAHTDKHPPPSPNTDCPMSRLQPYAISSQYFHPTPERSHEFVVVPPPTHHQAICFCSSPAQSAHDP